MGRLRLWIQVMAVAAGTACAILLFGYLDREHERKRAHSCTATAVNTVTVSPMAVARAFQITTSLVPGVLAQIDDYTSPPFTHRILVTTPPDINPNDVATLRCVALTLPLKRCGFEVLFLEEFPESQETAQQEHALQETHTTTSTQMASEAPAIGQPE